MSIPYQEALSLISSCALNSQASSSKPQPAAQTVALVESLGYRSAHTLRANRNLPPCSQSAMDGFAVRAADTATATSDSPVRLRVLGKIAAGDEPPSGDRVATVEEAGCWQIMTGASFPRGAAADGQTYDSCIRVEAVLPAFPEAGPSTSSKTSFAAFNSSHILITAPARPGLNLKPAGEDYAIGDMIIEEGQRIRAGHIMALASMGYARVEVMGDADDLQAEWWPGRRRDSRSGKRRRIRVGIINTGKEVVLPSDSTTHYPVESDRKSAVPCPSIGDSKIFNSNGPYLLSTLRSWGFQADLLRGEERDVNESDDPSAFEDIVRRAVQAGCPTSAKGHRYHDRHAALPDSGTESPALPPTPPHLSPSINSQPEYDLLISTGGVSTGVHDYVPSSIRSLGGKTIFHKVAIRPGHPVFFGAVPRSRSGGMTNEVEGHVEEGEGSGIPFFGLPGNPIATAVCLRFLVAPLLQALAGDEGVTSSQRGERPMTFARVLPVGWKAKSAIDASVHQEQSDQLGCGIREPRSGSEYCQKHSNKPVDTSIRRSDKPPGSHTKPLHTRCYVPARLHWDSHCEGSGEGGVDILPWVELLTRSASQASGFVEADCYVLLREGKEVWEEGEIVECFGMDV